MEFAIFEEARLMSMHTLHLVEIQYIVYTVASLIWTPLGQKTVS